MVTALSVNQCFLPGCEKPREGTSRNCSMHRSRWKRHGSYELIKARGRPIVERLIERVHFEDNGCWTWMGTKTPLGYGNFTIGKSTAGNVHRVHRVAYEALVGPIPVGLEIDHLCRNRACINPDHLEPVTRAENVRRGWAARKAAL